MSWWNSSETRGAPPSPRVVHKELLMSDFGRMVDAALMGILFIGILVGAAVIGVGWMLWHFVLSHISIHWT